MLWSTFWFSLMSLFVKLLSHFPAMELVFFRCGIASVIGLWGLKKQGVSWLGSNRKLLFLRGLFGTIALYLFILTIQNLPLGTAVTIQYISPIFTSIIAIFLLKEKVKPIQWLFFGISFLGVLLIKGFDPTMSWTYLGIGLFSALCSGFAYNMIRSMKELEHPLVVVLHFQLFGAIVGGLFSTVNFVLPNGWELVLLILTGITTQIAQVQMTKAFHAENVATVSILNYIGILYAIFYGWIFFNEISGPLALVGMLLVILGVLLNILLVKRPSKS